jgi:hypothetical protein
MGTGSKTLNTIIAIHSMLAIQTYPLARWLVSQVSTVRRMCNAVVRPIHTGIILPKTAART